MNSKFRFRWLGLLVFVALLSFAFGFSVAATKNNFIFSTVRRLYLESSTSFDPTATAHWQTMVSQFDVMSARNQIYMVGDSITESGLWSEMFPQISIANRGISGDRVESVIARAHQIPTGSVIFLMIGTNDVAYNATVADIERNYLRLIDTLSAKGKIFVQSTLFTRYDDRNEKIARLNSTIQGVCRAQPAKCEYVDLNSVIAPTGRLLDDMTFDGQHLNGAGYLKWKQVIAPIIERAVAQAHP